MAWDTCDGGKTEMGMTPCQCSPLTPGLRPPVHTPISACPLGASSAFQGHQRGSCLREGSSPMGEGALFPGGGHGLPSGIWPHTTDLTQLLKKTPAPPCRLGRLSGRTLWERRGNRAREETSLASGQSGARSLNVPGGGGLVWCLARGPKLRALTQPCAPPAWSFPARGYVRGRGRASWKPPGPPRRNRDPM